MKRNYNFKWFPLRLRIKCNHFEFNYVILCKLAHIFTLEEIRWWPACLSMHEKSMKLYSHTQWPQFNCMDNGFTWSKHIALVSWLDAEHWWFVQSSDTIAHCSSSSDYVILVGYFRINAIKLEPLYEPFSILLPVHKQI